MILVTGASGTVGGEVVKALAGHPVRAVVRDPSKVTLDAEVVAGDLELPESLTPALKDVDAVFLLGGWSDMPGLVRRIERAGATRVVLLTSRCVIGGRPDNAITRQWLDAEAAVRDIEHTILRPSGFQSNAHRLDLSRRRRARPVAGRADRADRPGRHRGGRRRRADTRRGAGARALRPRGAHARPAGRDPRRRAGRPLRYEPQPDAEARAEMLATGTPEPIVDALLRFFSEGEYDDSRVVGTVEAITGRAPGRFADWARRAFG